MKSKLTIVKIGGNIINDPETLKTALTGFSSISGNKILIHGGGKTASALAKQLNIESEYIHGRRVTSNEMLDVALMSYAGKINTELVASLHGLGVLAVGLTGADGGTLISVKRPVNPIDYGFVGDIVAVNTHIISKLLNIQTVPVFCALSVTEEGQLLNTNADTIASALASALAHDFDVTLHYLFEKNGVFRDVLDESTHFHQLSYSGCEALIHDGTITDGMIPKIDNCLKALDAGVNNVYIGSYESLQSEDSQYKTIITKSK